MSYVRVSKAELDFSKTYADALVESLSDAKKNADSFYRDAQSNSSSWVNDSTIVNNWVETLKGELSGNTAYGYNRPIINSTGLETGKTEWTWYDNKLKEEAKRKINAAKAAYDSVAKYIYAPGDSNGDATSVQSSLEKIIKAIETFESETPSLQTALETIGTLPEGFSVEEKNINMDGEEVTIETLVYTDENGNQVTIAEQVNAFYTYVGITVAADVAAAYANPDMSDADRDALLKSIGTKTQETVSSQLTKGFYSVASTSGISGMYQDAMGETTYSAEDVHNKYMSAFGDFDTEELAKNLADQTNSDRIGSMALAGLLATAVTGGEGSIENVSVTPSNLIEEKEEKEEEEEKTKDNGDYSPITADWEDSRSPGGGNTDGSPDGGTDSGTDNGTTDENPDPVTESNPEDAGQTDAEAQKISETIDNINETEPPATIDKETRTPEEIDSEARDDYFDGNEDAIREQREQQRDEYNNMTYEEKVDALKELGYPDDEAATLANNPAEGQTAYVYGKYNQELADSAKEIASSEGINDFDTSYDDKNTLANIENKTANIELTPTSENVQKARQELTVAKEEYDKSVTAANQAIDKAVEAKDNYNSVLKDIQSSSGKDPKDWTDQQVDQYNEAATMYNEAVKKANEAAKNVDTAKNTYAKEKEEYQTIYENWRKEAEKDVGITGSELDDGSISGSDIHYNQTDIAITTEVHDTIDDSSLSIGGAGDDKPVMTGNVDMSTDNVIYNE